MRYLFVSENELLYDFADFLWNNGNSIYVQKCSDYDCVVMIQDGNVSFAGQAITTLVFANDGIYTNAIPFPHKLFHIEQLDQRELDRFLAWCKKFRLFGYNERSSVWANKQVYRSLYPNNLNFLPGVRNSGCLGIMSGKLACWPRLMTDIN